jgi:hypothetical protein
MVGLFVVIALAVLAAIGVILLANASGGGTDLRTFWQDLRNGLRREPEDAPAEAEPDPVDVPFDRFFAEAPQAGDGYLQLDELAEALERTGERAVRLRAHLPQARTGGSTALAAPPAPTPGDREAAEPADPARPPRRGGHRPAVVVVGPPPLPPQRRDG